MKTVRITESFDAWPTDKAERRFLKGEDVELSDAFADLILGKKLAKLLPAATPEPVAPTSPAPAKPAITDGRGSRAVVIAKPEKDDPA